MTVSASICSVIRMMPSSAVSAEPARPVTIRAAQHGPELADERERHGRAQERLGAEAGQRQEDLQPEHHPGERAGQEDDQAASGSR